LGKTLIFVRHLQTNTFYPLLLSSLLRSHGKWLARLMQSK